MTETKIWFWSAERAGYGTIGTDFLLSGFFFQLMWAQGGPADASASFGAILVAGDNNESLPNLTRKYLIIIDASCIII